MRIWTLVVLASLVAWIAGATPLQITENPLPAPVETQGLMVEISDLVRLPETRGMRPPDQDVNPAGWARVSFVRDLPDGRRFINDSRGFLYVLDGDDQPHIYANFAEAFPFAAYNRLESGLIGFDFHPEFAESRFVLHRARRVRAGQPSHSGLHPARVPRLPM